MNCKRLTKLLCGAAVGSTALFGVGCDPASVPAPDNARQVYDVPRQQVEGARFKIESHGRFRAGFENNEREILVITDTSTKRQYIGITGVGISELRRESETSVSLDADGNVTTDIETHVRER